MAEVTPAPAPAPVLTLPAWHSDVEPTVLGKWQSKGYDLGDPKNVAVAATKAYMEAEGFIGAPATELIRVPKTAEDAAGWEKVWTRLGAPVDPKGYDFTTVKKADGTALDEKFSDHMRQTAVSLHLPKDTAAAVASSVVKFMDAAEKEKTAVLQAKLIEQKAALQKDWGKNADAHLFSAKAAANALGVGPEAVAALEQVIGYDKVMNMFRTIATKIGEDRFVRSENPNDPGVMTVEEAKARVIDLKADQAWVKRYLAGDAQAKREMTALSTIIAGATAG